VGSFRKARVAWAGSSLLPAGLARLQSQLEEGLRARGFALDQRPFAAHVTLAREIARPVPASPMAPIRWRAGQYVLARSETGTGRYSVMETWSLDRD
jgi:2'-5' RNA ligase